MQVLIADDDRVTRRQLELAVKRWGYEAICVSDGESALRVLESSSTPQLAIVDWQMPGIDGPTLCRHIRLMDNDKYTYVILLTVRDDTDSLLVGLAAGADDFLSKPFNQMELRLRLKTGQRIMHLQESLRQQATRDTLTGLWNRGEIMRICERERDRAIRGQYTSGLLLADLDHFKSINDQYGHLAGDAVLRQVATLMSEEIRKYNSVGRYGGEEFLFVLPGASRGETLAVGERIRLNVANHALEFEGQSLHVTISVGAAQISASGNRSIEQVIGQADQALYLAKSLGRNRICASWKDSENGRLPMSAPAVLDHVQLT